MSELSREQYIRHLATLLAIGHMIPTNVQVKESLEPIKNTDAALRATITQQAQELERVKRKNTNHFETLRGIAAMPVTDGERMQQWAKDGLSGYTGPLESTLLKLTDDLTASQARCREMERDRDDTKLDWKHMAYKRDQLSLENSKLTDQIAQLQATLAAREARIHDLERGLAAILQVLNPFTEPQQARGRSGGAANHGAGT